MTAERDGVGVQTRTLALAWPLSQLFFFFKSPLPERLSPELLQQSSGSRDKFFLVAQNTRTGFKPTILRHAGNTGVPIHGGARRDAEIWTRHDVCKNDMNWQHAVNYSGSRPKQNRHRNLTVWSEPPALTAPSHLLQRRSDTMTIIEEQRLLNKL